MTPSEGMALALEEARLAARAGEVPIGAVLVYKNQIISREHNHSERLGPLEHAELRALKGAYSLERNQLKASTLYVTLEPCPMCMGAILHSHLGNLVFGAYNLKWGSCGTVLDFRQQFPTENCTVLSGISENDCLKLLQKFFQKLR